jgi:hypothetical protein
MQLKTNNKAIAFMTTTKVRKNIADFVEQIKRDNSVIGIGRRNKIEVVVMKYPENTNSKLTEITNINANSSAFDFLKNEPDLYSVKDLKKRYV